MSLYGFFNGGARIFRGSEYSVTGDGNEEQQLLRYFQGPNVILVRVRSWCVEFGTYLVFRDKEFGSFCQI